MSEFGGPWTQAEARADVGVTPAPRMPPAAWETLSPAVTATVEAVQVGGVQYRVTRGTFQIGANGGCWWTSDQPDVTFVATLEALESVRCLGAPVAMPEPA